jgi:NAD(P)-dependent dehydrogenase (short-subunit alcohol dehydrogenase family)
MARAKNVSKAQVEEDFFKTVRPASLIQRFATTAEVASMVAYLASPVAAATNGAAVRVEGGVVRSIL